MRYTTQRLSIVGLTIAVSFTGFYLLFALAATASPGPKVAAHSLAVHNACDPITTNTTWASGVYTATDCNVVVPAGVTLTLQAGAVVKVSGGGSALIVNGGLVAQGMASQPVVFTSLADDAHGGDTDHNGASSGAAGDWYGVVFRSGSVGRLDRFFAGYAGSGAFNSTMGSYSRAQIDVQGADVQLRNGTVTTGLRKGVYLEGAGIAPVVENMTITANRSNSPSVSSTLGYPIYQSTINQQPTYSSLTFSGNDQDQVVVHAENVTQDVSLGGAEFGFVCGFTSCDINVTSGVTLTVQPGALIDMGPSYGFIVNDGGSLIAEGTATHPITFTSSAALSTPGQEWMGIEAQTGSKLRLDHCDISYANHVDYDGALRIDTDDAQVSNCHIHHNQDDGIYISPPYGGSLHTSFTNVDVTDNGQYGVWLDTNHSSLSVTWDGGSISRNGWSGVSWDTYFSAINPTFRNLTISDNGGAGDSDDRKKGIAFDYGGISPVFENRFSSDWWGKPIRL